MTIAQSYGLAVVPPVWRILGRRMVPMTPRHVLILSGMENPLSPLDFEVESLGQASLALAVEICSRPGQEAVRFVTETRPAVMRLRIRFRRLLIRGYRPWFPLAQFISYRRFWFFERPEISSDPKKSVPSEVPGLLAFIAQLVSQGCDRDALLDTPCRVLFWDSLFIADTAETLRVKEITKERQELANLASRRMTKEEYEKFKSELMEASRQHRKADMERQKNAR